VLATSIAQAAIVVDLRIAVLTIMYSLTKVGIRKIDLVGARRTVIDLPQGMPPIFA
jgi:hypothetical protein